MPRLVAQYSHQPIAVAALDFAHESPFDPHQPRVREIERNGDPGNSIGREPFLCEPIMRPKAYPPRFELAVQTLDGILQLRALNFELQVAEAQVEQLVVRQRFPRVLRPAGAGRLSMGVGHIGRTILFGELYCHFETGVSISPCGWPAPNHPRGSSSAAIASSSASVIASTTRRPSSPAKSNNAGSASWEPATLQMLEKIDSMRPGNFCSQSRSMFFTTSRCILVCEPHSVQGMIGNSGAAACGAIEASVT